MIVKRQKQSPKAVLAKNEFLKVSQNARVSFLIKLQASGLRCSVKKLFLKISQYSQENTCVGVSF